MINCGDFLSTRFYRKSVWISSLSLNLKNSSYTGAITGDGDVSVTLDTSSTWTLTGDSYLTEFNGDATNVISNGYTVYVNGTALGGTN